MVEPDIYNSIKSRIRNRKPKRFFDEDDDNEVDGKDKPRENGFMNDGRCQSDECLRGGV